VLCGIEEEGVRGVGGRLVGAVLGRGAVVSSLLAAVVLLLVE